MLFNSYIFIFVFFPIVLTVYWLLKGKNARYIWLTFASFVFYGYSNPKYTLLLVASILINFVAGLLIHHYNQDKNKKRVVLVLALILNLLLLGFFKYYNFIADTFKDLATLFGSGAPIPLLDIVLPIGISFYTFQTMSYTIDVYKSNLKPALNFFEFSCYITLFPHVIAGPIVRYSDIINDLKNIDKRKDKSLFFYKGILFFVIGLAKKVIIADSIAFVINPMFSNYHNLTMLTSWVAVIGYTYQLYFDFSGYSDMAVGLAYFLGFHFPQNFDSPYKARNISDFWKRWNISLSNWLRDYLYISLSGNRKGNFRTLVNLVITMFLGGLWHGANWTFVIWGLYHGFLLAIYHAVRKYWDAMYLIIQRTITFLFVIIGWVFFRSNDFDMAFTLLRKMFNTSHIVIPFLTGKMAALIILILAAFIITNFFRNTFEIEYKPYKTYAVIYAIIFVMCLIVIGALGAGDFLYYQF